MTATLTRVAFTAEAKALAAAAGWAARHIPAKPAPPILGGILLDVADGRLRVSGFDYDVCAAADVAVDTDSPGRVLVSGRLFAELVKTLLSREVAATIVDRYIARIEHHDGQRRVVLCGAWETDPAAVARYVPKADAA